MDNMNTQINPADGAETDDPNAIINTMLADEINKAIRGDTRLLRIVYSLVSSYKS